MSELYSISGRIDRFEFEQLSSIKSVKDKADGLLQGVTGGNLTWDFTSDTKVSGSLDVVDTPLLHSKYVRIYYISSIPIINSDTGKGYYKTRKVLLGTCYADTENGHLENGKYSGTIKLQGTPSRYTEDQIAKNLSLKKGGSVIGFIRQLFSWFGGQYSISGVKDRKVSATHVWDFGTSPYDILKELVSWINGYITVNREGVICIRSYVKPSKRAIEYTFPMGEESVTFPGVDISSSLGSAINRVAVKYVKTEKYTEGGKQKTRQVPIFGLASVASTNAASRAKTGKLVTHTETINSMKPETTDRANAIAKDLLSKESGYVTEYKVTSYYLPIWCNELVRFKYEKIDVDALVMSIDYDLSVGCKMTTVLRKIGNHKK